MKHYVRTAHANPLRAGLLAGVAAALIGGHALATTDNPATPCFHITQWQGWKAPDPNTLYLRVNMRDVYRVELSPGSLTLMWPDVQLISQAPGSNTICTAIDLQLAVVNAPGVREPLFARKLTKLTPEEIAAIPKKYRPN